jgi:hypothetical protein
VIKEKRALELVALKRKRAVRSPAVPFDFMVELALNMAVYHPILKGAP